jgi:hypothetical protein
MAQGDVLKKYATRTTLTQTNLDGLASSSDFTAGWKSPIIDNSSAGYDAFHVTAKLKTAASGVAAGEFRLYYVNELDDSNFPDAFGTGEGTVTITDTEVRDAICKWLALTAIDTSTGQTYYLDGMILMPARKGQLFIAQNSGQALESSGDPNQVCVQGIYYNVTP